MVTSLSRVDRRDHSTSGLARHARARTPRDTCRAAHLRPSFLFPCPGNGRILSAMPESPSLTIPPAARVGRVLAGCITFLVVAHVVTWWVSQNGYGLHRTARLFDLDEESNISTWFSSL